MPNPIFCETRTWAGSGVGRHNEDFARIDEARCCAMLVDGATGLTKTNLVGSTSDAAWYARELCRQTLSLLTGPTVVTTSALAAAGAHVASTYLQAPDAQDLGRADMPNGSLAIVRWQGDELEVTMLGDCTTGVLMRDGIVHVLHDATLDELDRQSYACMYAYATAHNTTMAEARIAVNDQFIRNRLKMNEPEGYWAADITCRGFGHELQRRFGLESVAGVFICSDGFAAAVDMGVVNSVEDLTRRVIAKQGAAVAAALRAAEDEDAGCWRVHRSKVSDDTTYAVVTFA